MSTNRSVAIMGGGIAAVIGLALVMGRWPVRPPAAPSATQPPVAPRSLGTVAARPVNPGSLVEDWVDYGGTRVPASAVRKLELAEKCKAKADEIASRYDSQHLAHILLKQAGAKLLKEDKAYAVGDRQKIVEYFDSLSAEPQYTNIAGIVGEYDNDPSSSGLFLDAAAYVVLHCQNREWQNDKVNTAERHLALMEQLSEDAQKEGASPKVAMAAESIRKSAPGYLDLTTEHVRQLDETQEAYRELFRFRWKERYGLDGTLLERLDPVVLTNAGPELTVPH